MFGAGEVDAGDFATAVKKIADWRCEIGDLGSVILEFEYAFTAD